MKINLHIQYSLFDLCYIIFFDAPKQTLIQLILSLRGNIFQYPENKCLITPRIIVTTKCYKNKPTFNKYNWCDMVTRCSIVCFDAYLEREPKFNKYLLLPPAITSCKYVGDTRYFFRHGNLICNLFTPHPNSATILLPATDRAGIV